MRLRCDRARDCASPEGTCKWKAGSGDVPVHFQFLCGWVNEVVDVPVKLMPCPPTVEEIVAYRSQNMGRIKAALAKMKERHDG